MDAAQRDLVRQRAFHRCEYCRWPQDVSELRFHIEHVIPRQHGGGDTSDNLALACPSCNLRKGPNLSGLDPVTGKLVPIFHPRREQWSEHFAHDGLHLVGKTDVGRTTVQLLGLNDVDRVRIRSALRTLGRWP